MIYKKKIQKEKALSHQRAANVQRSPGPAHTGLWLISLAAAWGPCVQQLPVGPAMHWPENFGDSSPGTVNQKLFIPVMFLL